MTAGKRLTAAAILFSALIVMQAFTRQEGKDDEKAKNLKVLSKNMKGEDLHQLMRVWSKSLGVRCGHCHQATEGADKKMQMDFASDAKKEKETARKMFKMTEAINKKYLMKMGDGFEPITCVTCHNGRVTPLVSTDSLPQKKKEEKK